MPRRSRLFLPKVPVHIVQRGHDRQPVFVQSKDFRYYLSNLQEMKDELLARVYAYCLMTNHVHLVVSSDEDVSSVSKLMRVVAGRQTRYVNRLEVRSGTLWEGRFKASMIDSEAYLLSCLRYVDLNPVRATMVATPEEYQWSSYRGHTTAEESQWLDEHPIFRALDRDPKDRGRAYEKFVADGIGRDELKFIRTAVSRNQLTGDKKFQDAIAKRTGWRILTRGRGRGRPSTIDDHGWLN